MHQIRLVGLILATITVASNAIGQVSPECQKLKKTDCVGNEYYEVHAADPAGNRGGSVPLAGNQYAGRVTIDTTDLCMVPHNIVKDITNTQKYSFWFICRFNNPVYGTGTGPGTTGEGRTPDNHCACPGLPKWSLVARWMSLDKSSGDEAPLSDWFFVGLGGTFFVPTISSVSGGSYHPAVYLQYLCNDDDYSDNSGWLHVHESWSQ